MLHAVQSTCMIVTSIGFQTTGIAAAHPMLFGTAKRNRYPNPHPNFIANPNPALQAVDW